MGQSGQRFEFSNEVEFERRPARDRPAIRPGGGVTLSLGRESRRLALDDRSVATWQTSDLPVGTSSRFAERIRLSIIEDPCMKGGRLLLSVDRIPV
jgi:hypothetical protein